MMKIIRAIRSRLLHNPRPCYKNVHISEGVVIEGMAGSICIGSGTVIEQGAVISTKYGGSISIGKECFVRRGAMILSYGGHVVLGDYCGVNIYTILYGHGGLKVGDWTRFAAHCVVIPANHGYSSMEIPIWKQPLSKKGIIIGKDVWVGANASILDGIEVGDGAVIGAGSVVTDNVKPFGVYAGNPARLIKFR